MDRFLKIGACLMTALLATGVAAATVDIAADGTLDFASDHGSGRGSWGGGVHVDDDSASADAAGGWDAGTDDANASGNAGVSGDVAHDGVEEPATPAMPAAPAVPEMPDASGSASSVNELTGSAGL